MLLVPPPTKWDAHVIQYWGTAEKERVGCSISPGTNFAANKGEELFGGLNLGLAGSLSVAAKHGS